MLKGQERLRQLAVGAGCAGAVIGGWLLWGNAGREAELVLLPEPSPAVAAASSKDLRHEAEAKGRTAGKAAKAGADKARPAPQARPARGAQAVQNPFALPRYGNPTGERPQGGAPAARPTAGELRLSGVLGAGEERLALVSKGGYDFCLSEGETREGITLLELGADYAVLSEAGKTRVLHLISAAGGGRGREAKNEARAGKRSTSGSSRSEREYKR